MASRTPHREIRPGATDSGDTELAVVERLRYQRLLDLGRNREPADWDAAWQVRFRAVQRRDVRARVSVAALVLAAVAIGAAPPTALMFPAAALQVVLMDAALAGVALLAWRYGTRRWRTTPSAVAFFIGHAAGSFGAWLILLDLGLDDVMLGFMAIIPLTMGILVPWTPREHARWLVTYWAAVMALAVAGPAAIPTGIRVALILGVTVSCLLSAFGNYEGETRRRERHTEALRLRRSRQELRSLAAERTRDARTDVLTGLLSRRGLHEDLGGQIPRPVGGGPTALILADLDHFKRYNDALGHLAGDRLLATTGDVIRSCLRPTDRAYRYGGEEFLLVLSDASVGDARRVVARIRARLRVMAPHHPDNGPHAHVTFSAGIAELEGTDERAMEEALQAADSCLYAAKAAGRDRTVWRDGDAPRHEAGSDEAV